MAKAVFDHNGPLAVGKILLRLLRFHMIIQTKASMLKE